MTPWRFEGVNIASQKFWDRSGCDYLAAAGGAPAAGAAEAGGAALPAVDGLAGVAVAAAWGCTAGLIQQA